jgi:hypothetical protein
MFKTKVFLLILALSGFVWATGITFTFANSTVTTDGTAKYFEFDVMAQASETGTKIGDNQVYFDYNTAGFGSSIATNEKITVEKGTLLQNDGPPYYNIINVADNTPSRVSIGVEYVYGDYPDYGNDVPTDPTQLLHVKIEIADTTQMSGLAFYQPLMAGQEYESDNTTKYDPVVASDTLDTELKLKPSAIENLQAGIPAKFNLYNNFPNPFNPTTTLKFDLPHNVANVQLVVYDILGQQVAVLYSGNLMAGRYSYQWNGKNQFGSPVPSGIYFASFKAGSYSKTIKMMLVK